MTVRHVLWSADDGSFSILDTLDEDSGDDVAVIGPGRPPAARRPRQGQRDLGGARPLRPPAARGRRPAPRPHRPRGPDRLPDHRCATSARCAPTRSAGSTASRSWRRSPPIPRASFGELPGLGERQAAAAADSWHESRAVRDLHVQLAPHGLAHIASLLHARHGADAMRVLHEDPYGLVEIDGVGFQTADKIALAADVPPDSERRAQAAAAYALAEAERNGHTHLPLAELVRAAHELLGTTPDPDVLASAPGLLADEGRVYRAGDPRPRALVRRDARGAGRRATRTSATTPATSPPTASPTSSGRRCAARSPRASRSSPAAPGSGKTVCTKAIVEQARGRERADRALRADRPRGAAPGGGDRPRRRDDPPDARLDAGLGARPPRRATPTRPTSCWSTRPRC